MVLNQGHVEQHGSFLELKSQPGFVQNLVMEDVDMSAEDVQAPVDQLDSAETPEEEEQANYDKMNGEWPVYKYYVKIVGTKTMSISALMMALYTGGQIYQSEFGTNRFL